MAYRKGVMPPIRNLDDLMQYVESEFAAVEMAGQETTALDLRPVYRAPVRPREGMIVFADGTQWNPGSGAGSYEYRGGAWVKL